MKWLPSMLLVLSCCGLAHGEDARPAPEILAVLERSQQKQLDAMPLADATSPRARQVRESFEKLMHALEGRDVSKVELRIVRGSDAVGETLHGRVVVADVALAELPEAERLFVLAHEVGHVMLDHWSQMGRVYAKWVPGPVEPQHTGAVAGRLGREASRLSYRQEFEADAFALGILRDLGLPDEDAVSAFRNLGWRNDTATHPGTRKRLAALRAMSPGLRPARP